MTGPRAATERRCMVLLLSVLASSCDCGHSHLGGDDGGPDATIDGGRSDAHPMDATVHDASTRDAMARPDASCAPVRPTLSCSAGYAPRGAPIDVSGALPYFLQRTCDGWAWMSFGGADRTAEIVRANSDLIATDSVPVANIPATADGELYEIGDATGFYPVSSRWLVGLAPIASGTPVDHVALYDLDGERRSEIVDVSPIEVRNVTATELGYRFLSIRQVPVADPSCADVFVASALLHADLSVDVTTEVGLGVVRLGLMGWRGDGWVGFLEPCDTPTDLRVWGIAEDGHYQSPRPVAGWAPGSGTPFGGGTGIFREGPVVVVEQEPTSLELVLTTIDPNLAVATGPFTVATPSGRVVAGRVEREGDFGYALLYQEVTVSGIATQHTRLLRFTDTGDVVQESLISTGPYAEGASPFLLRYDGDQFIAGYFDRGYVLDTLSCVHR